MLKLNIKYYIKQIWDSRLPGSCKLLPCCLSCPAHCKWFKVKLAEFIDRKEHTLDEINKPLFFGKYKND